MRILITTLIGVLLTASVCAQQQLPQDRYSVSSTVAVNLGTSQPIRDLVDQGVTNSVKKAAQKDRKRVKENFRGRRGESKAVYKEKEHQGEDPLWQKGFASKRRTDLETLVNINGISDQGSPHDPSGDVGPNHYVQMVNATIVAVYDLEGNLVQQFAANTLWSEFGGVSEGDPIVLYDEAASRWILTEFTDPANVLIAISEDDDPLGSYTAYNFSTPNFPDYPKYAITPEALVFTSNEEGPGRLHQYFIDRAALLAGDPTARMQRVEITGNLDTEAGFYVSTPVDWNGLLEPYDSKPVVLVLNDSSWDGGADQDQIDIYTFDIDYDDPSNTTVSESSIVTTPFDSYPCSESGFGFQCAPQLNGGGLDAIPEVIMNIPHQRNFGSHESLVFNFVTDATDGENLSAIRWVELRRTSESGWALHQEGTFAPDDGLDRYMGSIAMDEFGNIGMGYAVSSPESFVGVRMTGRFASDPLGIMTIEEVTVADGESAIQSFGRFGDYAQMSVSPGGSNTFWYTTEYAAGNTGSAGTRIVAFQLQRDSVDLQLATITDPSTSSDLTDAEEVTIEVRNTGIKPVSEYTVSYALDGVEQESITVSETLVADDMAVISFSNTADLSQKGDYQLTAYVSAVGDGNAANDSLSKTVSNLRAIDGALNRVLAPMSTCNANAEVILVVTNAGAADIESTTVELMVNGVVTDTLALVLDLATGQSAEITTAATGLTGGSNTLQYSLLTVNGVTDPNAANNQSTAVVEFDDQALEFSLIFNADEYPEETEFRLFIQGAADPIATGGLTVELGQEVFTFCGPIGECYQLIVTDEVGDGMCCGFGEGNFSVVDADGNTLVLNDGDFGQSAVETFCLGDVECTLVASFDIDDATSAAEPDGAILVEPANGVGPYQYSNDGGSTYQDAPLFDGLLPGDYDMVVLSADSLCTYAETVTVRVVTSTVDLGNQPAVLVMPNPTDGIFSISIAGLPAVDHFVNVEILDISGKVVQRRKVGRYDGIHKAAISLMAYPQGVYFVRVDHPTVRLLEKVVRI